MRTAIEGHSRRIFLRLSVFSLLSVCLAALWAGVQSEKIFNYEKQLGVVDVDREGYPCLTIEGAGLGDGTTVHLVSLNQPQAYVRTRVYKKVEKSCSPNPDAGPNDAFYSLRLTEGSPLEGSIAVGIVGFDGKFSQEDGRVRADLDQNGRADSFRVCASNEGLHITVWDGEPLKSARKWHHYYYLGYDVEPDCTDKDYTE